ncbi:MAG TPA: hypothetical protein ENG74_01360 [Thermoplasmatales archaeon]|nr:hypothetical protein [Thermoplasmatales archaeon]
MKKLKVAFFDFASCEGCQLQVANLEEEILHLIEIVDIVSFREVMKEHSDDYDIAIVEGSIIRPMDEERLKKIRERAKILIALGSCACIGGVNKLRNRFDHKELLETVYGNSNLKRNPFFDISDARAVDEIVKVDYYIPGCPINREEFKQVIVALALGKKPEIPDYPVCVECKKKENICVYEKGLLCLGPITRAGCDAICPTYGNACDGCRGILEEPSTKCVEEVFKRYNLTYDDLVRRWSIFNYGDKRWKRV